MQLDTIAIKNFHCFGPDGVSIELADPVTALIGANGSGKAVQVHPELYFANLVVFVEGDSEQIIL